MVLLRLKIGSHDEKIAWLTDASQQIGFLADLKE